MPKMLSIVGKSGSGKTTLIEKLIPELKNRGYRIGTVKHTHHEVAFDRKGKDSHRHSSAGAEAVVLASGNRLAMFREMKCSSLDALTYLFQDMDLVITEGYKSESRPKIEIVRKALEKSPIFKEYPENNFIALVSDMNIDTDLPRFGLEDVVPIADFIEGRFLTR